MLSPYYYILIIQSDLILSAFFILLFFPVVSPLFLSIVFLCPDKYKNISKTITSSLGIGVTITIMALLLGYLYKPSISLPKTIQILLSNGLFDAVSVSTTLFLFDWASIGRTIIKVPVAIVIDLFFSAIYSVLSLFFSILYSDHHLDVSECIKIVFFINDKYNFSSYFFVSHTTFAPTLLFLLILTVLYLAKLFCESAVLFFGRASSVASPIGFTASFIGLLAILLKIIAEIILKLFF